MLKILPGPAGRTINPAVITGTGVSDDRGSNGGPCALLYVRSGAAIKVDFPSRDVAETWVAELVDEVNAHEQAQLTAAAAADLAPSAS